MENSVDGLEEENDKIRFAFWKDPLRSTVLLPLRRLLGQRQLSFRQARFPVLAKGGTSFLHIANAETIFHMVKAQNGRYCWVRQFLEQWSHSWPHPFLSPPVPFHWCCHVLLLFPPRTFSPPSTPPPQGHTARIEEINGVRMEVFSTTFSLWWGQKWKWVAWKCKEFSTGSPSIWSCPVSPLSLPPCLL